MSATLDREHRAKSNPPLASNDRRGVLAIAGAGVTLTPQLTRSEVFSINFIRHETVPLRIRRTLIYVAVGYLAANVIMMVGLIGAGIRIRSQWQEVQTTISQGQIPSAGVKGVATQEMEALHDRATEDLNRLNAIRALQQRRFPVAGRLAALTKTLPARTWITALSGDREQRTMTIHAAYLIDSEKPYELPAKSWIEGLKSDLCFRQGLKRLELSSSSRKTRGSAKLFLFDLIAEWEPLAK